MKKALFLGIFAITAISFWSCTKEEPSKDSTQIAKEALEKVKEAPTMDTLTIAKMDTTWLDDAFQVDTDKPTFKQFVAATCAYRPQFFANYQVLRYLSDEKAYDGSKDNFVIEDGNDNDYLKFANNTKETDIAKLDSGTISSTYKIWQHDKGGKIFGVMYERKGDFVVIFYDFDPAKKLFSANYALTELVNKDLKRAKRDEYKEVVLSESGSNIEFVKVEDKVEKAICDRWDGTTFKYSSIPYTKQ